MLDMYRNERASVCCTGQVDQLLLPPSVKGATCQRKTEKEEVEQDVREYKTGIVFSTKDANCVQEQWRKAL